MKLPTILPSTRLAIQVAASGLVALIFVDIVNLERPYWVVLTAVVVMVGTFGETLTKSIDRTVGTLVGLAIGVAIYWTAIQIRFPTIILLVVAMPSVIFFKFASYRLMIVALTILLVFLFLLGGATDGLLIARLVDTAIGAAIATVVSLAVLPIPTRKPVVQTVDAYVAALKTMVQDSLRALAAGEWDEAIDKRANALRGSEADLERLAESLKIESALIGGSGQLARGAMSLLPVLRGHVDSIVQACEPAARSGLGPEIAPDLKAIDQLVSANLDRLRDALVTGAKQTIPRLDAPAGRIEDALAPKLSENPATRRDVMTVLNAILALRRLNRGLRHAVERAG
jgi:hypothetical protein